MNGYRKPSGDYLEVSDGTPVSSTFIPVARRPSANHVFATTWETDPLNAAICWRAKITSEITAEKNAAFQEFLDSPAGKAFAAMFQTGIDKSLWTLTEVRAKYRSL